MSSSKKNDNSSRFHTKDIWLLVYSQEWKPSALATLGLN
jgi:hypothetical protein